MSGATGSNEDLVSGRANYANSATSLWAERPTPPSADYNGGIHKAILVVEPAPVASEPGEWEPPEDFGPQDPVNAIVGIGTSGRTVAPVNGVGGVGVTGLGGRVRGAGVLGIGSSGGAGGRGVHGVGGNESAVSDFGITDPPGPGVLAQGGKSRQTSLRLPPGPGIVALAGGRAEPPMDDVNGAGVFAHGADGTVTADPSNPSVLVGPQHPGAGVVGRGGVLKLPPDSPPVLGAGVIALGGSMGLPLTTDTAGAGLYAAGAAVGVRASGPTGVSGEGSHGEGVIGKSDSWAGVRGESSLSRGGVFLTHGNTAQVQLVPHAQEFVAAETVQVTPIATPPSAVQITRRGLAGDLMALTDPRNGLSTLWFCVRSEGPGPAQWAQVLLGPRFDGVL